MKQGPVPPLVQIPRRWFLLPHECWLARRMSDRFQRIGLINPAQFRLIEKHGTLGLVMLAVFALQSASFAGVAMVGTVALVASDEAAFAYWILIVAILGALYTLVRLLQVARTKPDESDRDFLARAARVPTDANEAASRG